MRRGGPLVVTGLDGAGCVYVVAWVDPYRALFGRGVTLMDALRDLVKRWEPVLASQRPSSAPSPAK